MYLYGSYSSSSGGGGGGGVDRAGARGAGEGGRGGGAGGSPVGRGDVDAGGGGGGGGAEGVETGGGGGGALPGTGGARTGEGAGGGGARLDGFRDEGGGIGGFFPIGGGGLGFPLILATEDGRDSPRRALIPGRTPGGAGGAEGGAPGGFGAAPRGSAGAEARFDSGSERYGAWSWSAPVLTPPDFLSLGMPPANNPPSCGGAASPAPLSVSLLLLARFAPPGTGGASPGTAGGLPIPGIAGAPMGAALAPPLTLPTIGADRSLICVTFFSFMPLLMSPKSAPCVPLAIALLMPNNQRRGV